MIKLFGVSLASAVLIDAFIIRLIFIPSIMSILGKANWWLPGWLDRILPKVQIEPGEDEITDDEPVVASKARVHRSAKLTHHHAVPLFFSR